MADKSDNLKVDDSSAVPSGFGRLFAISAPNGYGMTDSSIVSAAYEHKTADASITEASIRRLIPAFYTRVRRDPTLGPIFDGIIGDRWPAHIETVISFWLYVTRLDRRYNARNFNPAHIKHAVIRADLIPRWLTLFRETTQDLCPSESATALVDIARRMAASLEISLNKRDTEI